MPRVMTDDVGFWRLNLLKEEDEEGDWGLSSEREVIWNGRIINWIEKHLNRERKSYLRSRDDLGSRGSSPCLVTEHSSALKWTIRYFGDRNDKRLVWTLSFEHLINR